MKDYVKILIISLTLISCSKEIEKKSELTISEFNLKTDIIHFKKKMTELDTIKIWFNHSACMFQAAERIEITKELDLIKIKTEYKVDSFEENPEWKLVYEKRIRVSDTIWDFEDFLKRNVKRQVSEDKKYGTLQISHNSGKLNYFTNGLADLNRFMIDFFTTMKKLHPENIDGIYGVEIQEVN